MSERLNENIVLKMNFHRFNLYIYDMQCLLDIVVNWFCIIVKVEFELIQEGSHCNETTISIVVSLFVVIVQSL